MTGRAARLAVLCALAGATSPAIAQPASSPAHEVLDTAPSLAELHELASTLASDDAAKRATAFDTLRTLGEDALDAMRARVQELAARFDVESALTGLSALRRVQGITDPAAEVDLAKGALPLLERDRSKGAVLAVELVAMLRALEAQKSPAATELIVSGLFALDSKPFRFEARRTRQRLGVVLIPALLRTRTHPRSWVRKFAEESLAELRVDSPGRAVQQNDVVLLAAILDAYGDTLTFDAMPVIVSYLTDERAAVRDAARRAIRRFGKNAIWQIRESYVNATGREADPSWGWQRILDELYRLHEAPKQEALALALDRATRELDAGELDDAEATLDRALLEHPRASGARVAALYTRIAAAHLDAGQLQRALTSYRRALRLDPEGVDAPHSKARVLYLEAELRLGQGVIDLSAYEKALELDPSFTRAAEALDELSGARAAREKMWRRGIGLVAALLLAIAGVALLRNARRREQEPAPNEEPTAPPSEELNA